MNKNASTSKGLSKQKMDSNTIRRSKRLAERFEDGANNSLVKMARKDLKAESSKKKRENILKNRLKNNSKRETLFDCGFKALKVIGSAYVDDLGTDKLCYLVKFENDQYELVLSQIAHEFCPMVCN